MLLDWSAYARVLLARAKPDQGRRLSSNQLELFDEAVALDELHVCTPFRLEARYSARCSSEFAALSAELAGFRFAAADAETWALAEAAQERLASAPGVSHRVKLPDLLVAAIASQHGLAVLHYDGDYATLAQHGGLGMAERWIALQGSVD